MKVENVSVLIVDDHPLFRKGVISVLKGSDIIGSVYEAGKVGDARKILKSQDVDLVILDLNLPDEDGFNFLKEIRKKFEELNVIILTMHKNKLLMENALKEGADGFISKDNVYEDLIEALKVVINGGVYIDKSVNEVSGRFKEKIDKYFLLTKAEKEIFQLLAEGKNVKEIAYLLNKSQKTVENQRLSIMKKLDVESMVDIVRIAIKLNLIKI